MGVLLFLFGTALAAGLYFVLADLLKIPRLATERALISAGRRERSLSLIHISAGASPDGKDSAAGFLDDFNLLRL